MSRTTSFWFLLTYQNICAKLGHLLLLFLREESRARGGERQESGEVGNGYTSGCGIGLGLDQGVASRACTQERLLQSVQFSL
jgi:hypothetical protein